MEPPMDVVKIKATDGSPIEFINRDPRQGGVKDVYFDPNRQYAVAFFRNPLDQDGRDRVESLVGEYRKGIFEQAGGSYWRQLYCWPEKMVEYEGRIGIVLPFFQSKFFFGADTDLDGVEKEGKWFASAKNLNRFVPPKEKGNLLGYLKVCLQLSRAVRRLHIAGLAHSDLSYKNCLIDPSSGGATIIDIDGLVVPGKYPPDVVGTPDFIAPEVVASERLSKSHPERCLPSRKTDEHALAVLIYQYLFHRHPLRGGKFHSQDSDEQELLEMGEKALFIEHPSDPSNRFKALKGSHDDFLPWVDTAKLPYSTMGPYLKSLFEQAFIHGLHSPENRPSANEWEDALIKTTDLIQPCLKQGCVKGWFVFDNSTRPVCPYCGASFKGQLPVLDFYSSRDGKEFRPDQHRLMVYNNQYLYPWHVDRNIWPTERLSDPEKKPVGYFAFHEDKWIFINQTLSGLKDLGAQRLVKIGDFVELKEGTQLLLSSESSGSLVNVSLIKA
jgi:serine/threonine protein kinase